jgi:hypothetical protein
MIEYVAEITAWLPTTEANVAATDAKNHVKDITKKKKKQEIIEARFDLQKRERKALTCDEDRPENRLCKTETPSSLVVSLKP